MGLSVSFYKQDAENIIAAFKKNDLMTVEKIHLKHQTESGQMQVLLPAVQKAASIAQNDPAFALAVSEYVVFHGMGLNDGQRALLCALRQNDVKKAHAACSAEDAEPVLKALARMPRSAAYKAMEAYQAAYGSETVPAPLKTAKKAFLRIV